MSLSLRIPAQAPTRPVRLFRPDIAVERKADGTIYLRARQPLAPYPAKLTERLVHWASAAPERPFLAQRDAQGTYQALSYAQTLARARSLGEALLGRGLSAERPIVILSGNDIEHALLGLAALYIGVPYAPVSPAYSLLSKDFAKLRYIVDLLTPGLVFVNDGSAFQTAIAAAVPKDIEVVVARNPLSDRPTTLFAELLATPPSAAVDAAHDRVGPDTIAKFLFTSGSTGTPKPVINTQRMWCCNQMMLRTSLAFLQDEPPVIVDWAPWHHTAGGNHNVGLVLFNGGTLYLDDGKPMPGAIEATVRNLREVAPTWYFNVPKGFEALLPYLRADAALRRNFFSRLKVLWFAGAGLSQPVFDAYKQLAIETCGEEILFLTGFGATETAPFALSRTWPSADVANMGLPSLGMELKLAPVDGKLEARVRGPNITPGYWRQPEQTAAAFDEEGFYRLGDAFRFADPADPSQGLLFEGRIAEDFKLSTGTWVGVGQLRLHLLAHLAPHARDVVIAGADRGYLAVLIFPDLDACRRLAPQLAAAAPEQLLADARVRGAFTEPLAALARQSTGSSNRVSRALLLAEPPSLDAGEITDKGSLNQRAVLERRRTQVEQLYADPPPPQVIVIEDSK